MMLTLCSVFVDLLSSVQVLEMEQLRRDVAEEARKREEVNMECPGLSLA